MRRTFIDFVEKFKPGDPAPEGYLAWHEWARVQCEAGLKQVHCPKCMLLRFPQEYSKKTITIEGFDRNAEVIVCMKCAEELP